MITNWIGRMFAPSNAVGNSAGHENGMGNGNGSSIMRAPNDASLAPLVDPDDVLSFEVGRARRYERALSIVVVSPVSWPDDHEAKTPPVRSLLTATGLREILRETDIMCYQPADESFVLGLTESEGPAARLALERVQVLFKSRLSIDLAIGVAQFPRDGLTLDDLVAAARAQAGAIEVIEAPPAGTPVRAPPTRRPSLPPLLTPDALGE